MAYWTEGHYTRPGGAFEAEEDTYLHAEFPHLWDHIKKFENGKTEYDPASLHSLLGKNWEKVVADLVAIGVLGKKGRGREITYWFPYIYRKGLSLTQGRA